VRARILLADDHQEMRDTVVHLLEQEFDIVQTVEDGNAFLEAARKFNPDLCLIDISMPQVNGINAASQLRQSGSLAKIIMLTIHEDGDFARAAFKNGATGYVVKSRMATDLRLAVKEVLAGRTFVSSSVNFGPANVVPERT
jgi:DNA-binding NarL/FixJ family response regulator